MKRRKQIGKLIYSPTWHQAEVELGEDYEGLSRDDKLEVSAQWISNLLSMRNEMITNPKSWHHFMGDKSWVGLTDEDISELRLKTFDAVATNHEVYRAIEAKLKERNT